jgi:hypothetical protein
MEFESLDLVRMDVESFDEGREVILGFDEVFGLKRVSREVLGRRG